MGMFRINRRLLPPKLHYLLYFGGVAALWPYIAVFGKQLGLSESHVGYIFAVVPIAGIISMPLFGAIADRFKIKKKLFLVFNVLNLVAILCFAFLPMMQQKLVLRVTLDCGSGYSNIQYCSNDQGWNTTVSQFQELKSKQPIITCQVDCKPEAIEVEEFCQNDLSNHHKNHTFCKENLTESSASAISLRASLNLNKMIQVEECLFDLKVEKYAEITGKEDDLNFTGLSCFPPTKLHNCELHCPDLTPNGRAQSNSGGFTKTFWLYAFFILLAWISMAVVTSVADALCFQTLGERHDLYGLQRQWGAVGWGLFTLVSGFLVDVVSGGSIFKNYAPCFWIAGILLLVNFIVCWKWEVEEEMQPKAFGRRILTLIAEPKITVFIFACMIVGMCTGLLWNFLFWYIEILATERMDVTMTTETMKWIKLLQGLISVVQCFGGELPFFYLAGPFLKKFGHVNSMTIVIGTFGIRFVLYSFLRNPWWVLPIELLQGLTYGIFYTNMATYAYVVSPDGTAATVQGIVGAAFEGVGVSLGSFIGGLMFERWTGRTTFRFFGISALLMCMIYKGVMMTLDRRFEPVSQHQGNDFGTEMKQIEKTPTIS